ncbi:hypothetical protein KNO15_01510 [Leifsonia shinshuensis]|uniref:DUF6186 family protein n=1 Tax=Leifsonia shinshuensis TaxID=150026 RepID=UPI001F513F91|nr:DUF6186 family protein [Leifsonia shinshuensis]MCI0155373.1 hypothetical protein [Leifsonia shinshuensis]
MRWVTIGGFVLCGVLMVALVVQSRWRPDRIAPLGTLLDRIMADRAARFTILLFWWWLGWHFLVTPPG